MAGEELKELPLLRDPHSGECSGTAGGKIRKQVAFTLRNLLVSFPTYIRKHFLVFIKPSSLEMQISLLNVVTDFILYVDFSFQSTFVHYSHIVPASKLNRLCFSPFSVANSTRVYFGSWLCCSVESHIW